MAVVAFELRFVNALIAWTKQNVPKGQDELELLVQLAEAEWSMFVTMAQGIAHVIHHVDPEVMRTAMAEALKCGEEDSSQKMH